MGSAIGLLLAVVADAGPSTTLDPALLAGTERLRGAYDAGIGDLELDGRRLGGATEDRSWSRGSGLSTWAEQQARGDPSEGDSARTGCCFCVWPHGYLVDPFVRNELERVKHCYDRALRLQPGTEGTVMLRLRIDPQGYVAASIRSTTLDSPVTEQCLVGLYEGRQLEPWRGGLTVVSYPFRFSRD